MVPDLILVAIAADVVGNVPPGPQAVDLGAFQQQEFFVGAPFAVEDGKRVLFDDSERMCRRLMGVTGSAVREALYTEVILVAGTVGATDPDLREYMLVRACAIGRPLLPSSPK